MGNYIADILWQALLALIAVVCIHAFALDLPKVEALFAITVFANPPFIYFVSFIFRKEESGSLFTKLLHFVLGLIAPITFVILQFVNEKTLNIYEILRWFAYPFPIFSLIFGYINISNREITMWIYELEEEPAIYGTYVAGYSLYFLLGSVAVYWALVALLEMQVLSVDKCLSRRQKSNQVSSADPDVEREEQAVANKSPEELKVRVSNLGKTYGSVTAVKKASFGLEYGECFALLGVSGAGKTTCFKTMTGEIFPSQGSVHIHG
jgi:ABC-type multidrug transport system fused ATPase/permease subunit